MSIADFNRDGNPDVLIACEGGLYLFPGNGNGTLGQYSFLSVGNQALSAAVGDFNHDGIPDIAFTSNPDFYIPSSTQVNILIGWGDGTFATGESFSALGVFPDQLVVADFNGNGILDIAVLDEIDSVFSILSGNGDGTFQPFRPFGTAANPNCMLSGRFRPGSKAGERDLVFCTEQGIGIAINTTQ